jgi:hypothetical protein
MKLPGFTAERSLKQPRVKYGVGAIILQSVGSRIVAQSSATANRYIPLSIECLFAQLRCDSADYDPFSCIFYLTRC